MSLEERIAQVGTALGDLRSEEGREVDLRAVAQLCAAAVAADRCTLYVIDHERSELHGPIEATGGEIVLPMGQGLAGQCAANGETIIVEDAYADPRFDRSKDSRTGYRTKNMLVLPIWGIAEPARVVGVIQVLNKRSGVFELSDRVLLERVAGAVAGDLEGGPPVRAS